jgi:hypothetical protein
MLNHMCTAGAHTCQSLPKACIYSKVPSFSECWCSSGAFSPIEVLRGCERVIRLKEPNSAVGMLYAGTAFLGAFFLLHLLFALLLPCSFLCHAPNGRNMRLSTRVAGDTSRQGSRVVVGDDAAASSIPIIIQPGRMLDTQDCYRVFLH